MIFIELQRACHEKEQAGMAEKQERREAGR